MAPKKLYYPEQMIYAIEAVKKGSNLLKAAKKYGVPRITLRNKITGISPIVCGMGPPSILTKGQEAIFVQWLNDMSDKHCPVGKEHLLDSVQQFVIDENIVNPFKNDRPGKKWFHSFLKRHPRISERMTQNFSKSKDDMTQEKLKSWFSDIYDYLQKKRLQDVIKDPRRIFTSDEATFYLNPMSRVLVKRNESNIYSVVGNNKENPRVFLTANAAGQLAPPMVTIAIESTPSDINDSIPGGWGIGRTKTGWMCGNTLYQYVTKIFYPWLIENDIKLPVIYFLDGDATHLTYQLSEFSGKKQIELLALYPNTTEILKTMDVALFRPLRAFWKKECNEWKVNNLKSSIKKENFGTILEKALEDVTPACIKNGFKVGGLYPFGYKYIDFTQLKTIHIGEPDGNDIQFLNTLEKEIVINFTQTKLDLFDRHFKKKINVLPKGDAALYTIWSKYKDKCEDTGDTFTNAFDDSMSHASSEYEIALSPKIGNDFEEGHREGSESYVSSSKESNEAISNRRLNSFAATKLLVQNNRKNTSIKVEQDCMLTTRPRTIKELREFNKKQSKVMLEQQQKITQEALSDMRKREPQIEIQAVKSPKNIFFKEEVMSSEETMEPEINVIEYDSVESTGSYRIKEEEVKIDNHEMGEIEEKKILPVDTVKQEIEDDSVIIYVTDDDVNILYY